MNNRPKLQRSPLALPSYPGYNDALWGTLLERGTPQQTVAMPITAEPLSGSASSPGIW